MGFVYKLGHATKPKITFLIGVLYQNQTNLVCCSCT